MDATQKMFKILVNGQSAMKSEIIARIDKLEKKVDAGFAETKREFKKVHKRIDKIGLLEARLEDDAPTVEEFDSLEKRVFKLEQKALQTL